MGGFLSNPLDSVKSWVSNPGKAAENSLGSLGLTKQNLQNTLQNPLVQGGAGLALSFVPGMQWYAPLALGGGMSLLGGGNLRDHLSGAGMAGLGFAGGNMLQAAPAALNSAGTRLSDAAAFGQTGTATATSTMPSAAAAGQGLSYTPSATTAWATGAPVAAGAPGSITPYAMGGGMSNYAAGSAAPSLASFGTETGGAGGYPTQPGPGGTPTVNTSAMPYRDMAGATASGGAATMGANSQPAEVELTRRGALARTAADLPAMAAMAAGAAPAPAAGGFSPGLGSMMALKGGLGLYQNWQGQDALDDELDARRRAFAEIEAMEADPSSIYRNDPGLAALRRRRLDDVSSRYRAQHGGTAGGAFAKSIQRSGAEFDQAALGSAINRRQQMLGLTAPAVGYNLQTGGTRGGAVAQAGQSVLDDYVAMQMMQQFFGGRK